MRIVSALGDKHVGTEMWDAVGMCLPVAALNLILLFIYKLATW